MNELLTTFWGRLPVADIEVFRSMGNRFNPRRVRLDSHDLLIWLAIAAGVALAIFVLSTLLSRQERIRRYSSPRGLFRALCRAHELARGERRLLKRLARHHQLSHPARLFLEIERFDPGVLGPELQAHAEQFAALRDRLFAEPPQEAPATETHDTALVGAP